MKKYNQLNWDTYKLGKAYDEMISGDGTPRAAARELVQTLAALSSKELRARQRAAENAILEMGVTFTVYSEGQNIDRQRAWFCLRN